MSAFSGARTTATLRAESAVVLRLLRADELPDEIRPKVLFNISKITIGRLSDALEHLQHGHEQRVDALRTQLASTVFASRMLWALSIYVLLLPLNLYLKSSCRRMGSFPLFSRCFFLHRVDLSDADDHGFCRVRHAPEAMGSGVGPRVWLSVPVLAAVLLAKYLFLRLGGSGALFEPMRVLSQTANAQWWHWAAFATGYVAMSYAQEFIRCATQGSLAAYYRAGRLVDRWKSVAVATIVFAAMHVHLSEWFALIALVAGLYWGWMYQREKSDWGWRPRTRRLACGRSSWSVCLTKAKQDPF
jgi:membrane protease YdiL (CAAX protease family)